MSDQLRTAMGLLFGIVAIVALIYVYRSPIPWEGFVDSGRCGWGLGVCPDRLRCINGYCKSDIAPQLPELSDLPVRPDRYTDPVAAPKPVGNVSGVMNCAMTE